MADYRFYSGSLTHPGEIPYVALSYEDELPPIDQVREVEFRSRHDNLAESELGFHWQTAKGAIVRIFCHANDKRLRPQYQAHQESAEKIVVWMAECIEPDVKRSRLCIGQTLGGSEVPVGLKTFVQQVEIWAEFVQKRHSAINHRLHPSLDEGRYMFLTESLAFTLYLNHLEETLEDVPCSQTFFDFDPQTQPPQLIKGGAVWELKEEKILVVVPHLGVWHDFAEFYGYTQALDEFLAEQASQEAEKKAFKQRLDQAEKEKKTKTEQKVAAARAQLKAALIS